MSRSLHRGRSITTVDREVGEDIAGHSIHWSSQRGAGSPGASGVVMAGQEGE